MSCLPRSKDDVGQPQFTNVATGTFPSDFGIEDKPSVMILYARGEDGEQKGRLICIPFKQRGTDTEMYGVEVKDLVELRDLLLKES